MVAQKITVSPRQGDDNGTQFNSNQRQGFFANESQGSTFSETNRHRSLKVPKEPTGERSARSNPQRKNRIANIYSNANNQLFRGKRGRRRSNTMFHDMDYEFLEGLVQLTSAPVAEGIVQSIDSQNITEKARAYHTDTQHTPSSPQGWDVPDANSPSASIHNQTLSYPVSPEEGIAAGFNTDVSYNTNATNQVIPFQEQFLDISTLSMTIDDLAPASVAETNSWETTDFDWQNTDDLDYTKPTSNTHIMPFIDQEDSLDAKYISVIPREVESNDVVISDYIINEKTETKPSTAHNDNIHHDKRSGGLSLDVARYTQNWQGEVISTPEVLSYVEQLEKEKCTLPSSHTLTTDPIVFKNTIIEDSPPAPVDYEPITPKSEPQIESDEDIKPGSRKRRRNDSEDSDVSYTPYSVSSSPRKYRKRKPSIPIKDMIRALEGAQQQTKARRGRPPKRRESDVSAVSENSTHEISYRKLRDKNNEASKRSRMNRKLKELQMEQMAVDLEERNKRLRIRAELLEEATKKLRDAFMLAVSQKKAG
ncbi:unnamed protein product [Danaus chrysippus]|uniref:(African queen) hypothetical protein n=1 Tax=Danaus chrysippus TaxID=151541 RepID=A0A8J2RFF4_9NEOP|nr:unnamed protein product [Danaus chrysippus]